MDNNLLMERMLEAEALLDSRLLKRQSEVQDASFKVNRTKRSLLLNVTSIISGEEEDLFTFKLGGSLEALPSTSPNFEAKPFTHFISSFHLEIFNSNNNTNNHQFSWSKGNGSLHGSIEFQKRIPKPHPQNLRIVIMMDELPSPFLLSQPLSSLMGRKRATKPQAILAIWQYVKGKKLQESEEKKIVVNDQQLKELFGVEKMSFSEIPSRLLPHLLPNEPFCYDFPFLCQDNEIRIDFEMDERACYEEGDVLNGSNRIKQRELQVIELEQNEIILALRASIHQKAIYSELRDNPKGALERLARIQQSPESTEAREANLLWDDDQEDGGRLLDIVRVLVAADVKL